MRKILLFLLPVLLPAFYCSAQCLFPVRLEIANLSPSIPNADRDPDENANAYYSPYVENFHPIGWSNDGKAAYLVWGESPESCHFGVLVYDVQKDTIAGKWFENMKDNTILDAKQVPLFWERDKDSILPLLKSFNIIWFRTSN